MRTHAFVTTTALACVLLAGCTDDPVGPVDDTSAPTTSASPTPTGPTPPPLPEAAKADTAKGAIAFVGYYVELMNYSARTGRTDAIEAATSPECATCANYIGVYRKTKSDGGSSGDPGWVSTPDLSEASGDEYTVLTTIKTRQFDFKASADAEVKSVAPATYKLIYTVSLAGKSPMVEDIQEQVGPS